MMKSFTILKTGIGVLTGLLFVWWLIMFSNASIKDDNFIEDFLFSTYILFVLFTTTTYFTTLIGKSKVSLIPLLLYLLVFLLITLMYVSPDSVIVLWQFTLISFILQVTQSIYGFIQQKNLLSTIAKIWLIITATIALAITIIKPESISLYTILYTAIVSSGALVAINFLIPAKNTTP